MRKKIIIAAIVLFVTVAFLFAVPSSAKAWDDPFNPRFYWRGLTMDASAYQTGNGVAQVNWTYTTEHDVFQNFIWGNGQRTDYPLKTDGTYSFSHTFNNVYGTQEFIPRVGWKPTFYEWYFGGLVRHVNIIPAPVVYAPWMTGTQVTNAAKYKSSISLRANINAQNAGASFIVNGKSYSAQNDGSSMWATVDGLPHDTTVSVQAVISNVAGSSYSNTIYVKTARVPNTNNKLISVGTSRGEAEKVIDTAYALTVPYLTPTLTVTPIIEDTVYGFVKIDNASYQKSGSAFGAYAQPVDTKSYTITVKAENGSTKTYTLTVTREEPPAPDISLTTGETTQYRSAVTGYNQFVLSGTVSGGGSPVTVSTTVDGEKKSVLINTPATGSGDWSLCWDVVSDSIAQGDYTEINVTADNGYGTDEDMWTDPG
ncbi:MAG: cadherin-like beta sandwich domain-containing protein, partial [Eubacteriales bacterium]